MEIERTLKSKKSKVTNISTYLLYIQSFQFPTAVDVLTKKLSYKK